MFCDTFCNWTIAFMSDDRCINMTDNCIPGCITEEQALTFTIKFVSHFVCACVRLDFIRLSFSHIYLYISGEEI